MRISGLLGCRGFADGIAVQGTIPRENLVDKSLSGGNNSLKQQNGSSNVVSISLFDLCQKVVN